jgi:predicted enzyme related to lactoylglutathione lyase
MAIDQVEATEQMLGVRQVVGRVLAAAVVGMSAVSPLTAQPLRLSPLVTPSSQQHRAGKVVLVQLVTPDLTVAERFYDGPFGWRFRDLKLGSEDDVEASIDGQLVAGLTHKALGSGERRQSSWLTFLAVRDVDATKKLAVAHGAKVLLEPHTVANRGREAVFSDPQGTVFAVLASSTGDPPDEMADPRGMDLEFAQHHGPRHQYTVQQIDQRLAGAGYDGGGLPCQVDIHIEPLR